MEKFLNIDIDKTGGNGSLLIVQEFSNLTKTNHITPAMLNTLLSLKLSNSTKTIEKKPFKRLSKRAKKLEKVKKEVERDHQELLAQNDLVLIRKNQSRILEFLFLIYFRILKSSNGKLLSAALDGLKHFSGWMDVSVWADLFSTIKVIAFTPSKTFPELFIRLKAICVTLEIMHTSRGVIQLDLKDWFNGIYNILFDSLLYTDDKHEFWTLIFTALDLLTMKQKETKERVAAMLKRLLTVLLSDSSPSIAHIMAGKAYFDAVMVKYSLKGMLEDLLSGVYNPECQDVDLVNPFSTMLWEVTLLKKHAHPSARGWTKEEGGDVADLLKQWDSKAGFRFIKSFREYSGKDKKNVDVEWWDALESFVNPC